MLRFVLLLLAMQPGVFCTGWFLKDVVPIRKPFAYALITSLLCDVQWIFNNLLLPQRNIFTDCLVYTAIYIAAIMVYGERAQRMRTILVQAILFCVPIFLAIVFGMLLPLAAAYIGGSSSDFVELQGKYYLPVSVMVNIVTSLFLWGISRLLRALLMPVNESRSLLWFCFVPLSQIVLMIMYSSLFLKGGDHTGEGPAFGLAVLLCAASDIACVLGYRKYRKIRLESMRLQETEHQLQLQAEHYRNLQEDILRVNQIRHDLKNQLQAAYYLLEQGNSQEARQQLDLLENQLSQKVGSRFCENLMVDAVLTEKVQLCREKGIRIQVSAPVPQEISVENAYLCSAFSNLLDNAITGTLESAAPCGPIDLSCDIQGDYLSVSCSNPGNQPEKKADTDLLREHGLGLDILKKIAEMGSGHFSSEWEDGVFHAVLILRK